MLLPECDNNHLYDSSNVARSCGHYHNSKHSLVIMSFLELHLKAACNIWH